MLVTPQSNAEHAAYIRAVLDGAPAGSPVDEVTLRSWQRCRDRLGLDPASPPEPVLIAPSDLSERFESNCCLLDIARSEMTDLYQQLAGSGHAIMLTDRDGVLLNYIGDPDFTDAAARVRMQTGALWSEAAQGTNGMGTCLVEKKPLVIHKNAHFFTNNTSLTCAAAPIFDPHGDVLAILDASSEAKLAQRHTMVLLNMSAQVIENRIFFCAMQDHFVLRFHSRPEFISILGEGAIAFDPEGRIIAANRSALFQMGIDDSHRIIGTPIQRLFTTSLAKLLQQAHSTGFHAFPIRDVQSERRFFAKVQPPETVTRVYAASTTSATAPARGNSSNVVPLHGSDDFDSLHFGDPQMARNINTARRMLRRDIPIMLFGETGTGKDLFARTIHDASSHSDKPFVAVNCASLPETLIESELFGYRPGAFTGANRTGSRGKIVQADGGTLFLDEIGDMPMHLQARLLRVLEERAVIPLGGDKPIPVSIRVISATHHDIRELIARGEFREDLFYRLHGISLTMPSLRERTDRHELIIRLTGLEADSTAPLEWDPEALSLLEGYAWPGNIRQLRNVLRAATALCDGDRITLDDLPQELFNTSVEGGVQESTEGELNALNVAEREALLQQLEAMHWNVSGVSKELGLSRNTLYRKMKRYNITPPR